MKISKKFTRKALSMILALAMLLSSYAIAVVPASAEPSEAAGNNPYRVISYVTDWNWPGTYDADTDTAVTYVDPWRVTHINYSFGLIDKVTSTVRVPNPGKLRALVDLKKENPDLKVLLSIGGWGADGFSEIAASTAKTEAFAKSCLQVIEEYGIDGVDLDWEYPGIPGDGLDLSGFNLQDDGKNQVKLYKKVREVLTWDYYLTIASGVGYDWLNRGIISEIPMYLDYITIMCYDLWGEWQDASDYNCNFKSKTAGSLSVEFVCDRLYDMGYQKEIMVIGFPMYGRDRNLTNRGNDSWLTYDEISKVKPYLTYTFNSTEQASSLSGTYNGRTYNITYDDVKDFEVKVDWLASKGYGGAMYWEYSQDADYDKYDDDTLYPTAEDKVNAARQDGPMTQKLYDLMNAKGNAPALPYRYENPTTTLNWSMGAWGQPGYGNFGGNTSFFFEGKIYTVTSGGQNYHIGYPYGQAPTRPGSVIGYNSGTAVANSTFERNEYSKDPTRNSNPLKIDSVNVNYTYIGKNQPITWDVKASGGTAPYTYQYQLAREEVKYNPNKISGSPKNNTTPSNYVQLWIVDQNGQNTYKGDTNITGGLEKGTFANLTPQPDLTHVNTLTAATSSNEVTFTVANSLGSTLYSDTGTNGTKYYPLLNSSSPYYKLSNPTKVAVNYNKIYLRVYVTDATGKVSTVYSQPVTVVDDDVSLDFKGVEIVADKSGTIEVGTPINWTAKPDGGEGTINYTFDLYKDGALVTAGTPTTDRKYPAFTPRDAGVYQLKVSATDGVGTTKTAVSDEIVVWDPFVALQITSINVIPNKVVVGSPASFKVTATGGAPAYAYSLLITKGGKVYYYNANSASDTLTYAFMETGTYSLTFYVRDTRGQQIVQYVPNYVVS